MMTEEQRYLFDLCGFLHLKNVLTPEELDAASDAANRYIDSAPEDLPPHFGRSENRKGFAHGFAFDRALEKLVFLPAVWPIVLELTNGKPMLASGTMLVDSSDGHTEAVQLHCARDDYGFESARYEVRRGRIYCDDFVVFPYLDDVLPGDGGLLVVPGSHKSEFDRPPQLFNQGLIEGGGTAGARQYHARGRGCGGHARMRNPRGPALASCRPPAPGADAALPATPPPSRPHSRGGQRAAGTRNTRIGRIGALHP